MLIPGVAGLAIIILNQNSADIHAEDYLQTQKRRGRLNLLGFLLMVISVIAFLVIFLRK